MKENNKNCVVHRELRRGGNNQQQRMPAAGSNKNKNNMRTTKARNEFSQSMPPDRPVRHDATSNNNNKEREGNPHINTHTHKHGQAMYRHVYMLDYRLVATTVHLPRDAGADAG